MGRLTDYTFLTPQDYPNIPGPLYRFVNHKIDREVGGRIVGMENKIVFVQWSDKPDDQLEQMNTKDLWCDLTDEDMNDFLHNQIQHMDESLIERIFPCLMGLILKNRGTGTSSCTKSRREAIRLGHLIAVISSDRMEGRLSALQELTRLCDQDGYKLSLIERGHLLPALVKILSESGVVSADQAEAATCCWYLSRTNDARLPIVSEKGMITALISIIQRSQGEARSAALACFVNCALISESVDYLLNSSYGLLSIIATIITTDSNEANVTIAYNFLANIVGASSIWGRIDEFLRLDLHILALNVLKPLGPHPHTWKNRFGKPFFCLLFLMYISVYPEAALSLKSIGTLDVLAPILSTSDREAISAALIVTLLTGKDESNSQIIALPSYPHLTDILVDLLEAQLSGGKGAAYDRMIKRGYNFTWYPINLVVRGILALSMSDANKRILIRTRILSLLVQLLQRFHDNAPPVGKEYKLGNSTTTYYVGGGGTDKAAATAAIETIVQLTFFFHNDTELIQQFITSDSGVEKLFGDLLELSAARQLNPDAQGQVSNTKNTKIYLPQPPIIPYLVLSLAVLIISDSDLTRFLFPSSTLSISQLQTLLKRFTPYLAYPHDSSLHVAPPELITAPRHGSGNSFGSGSSSSGGGISNSNFGGSGGHRRPPELITAPRHGSGSSFGSGNGVGVVSHSNFGGNGIRKPLVLQPLMKSNSSNS